ncbi:hypothetical protein [Neobacillus sp. FSL H8-0543]|uniref:hypothetical protein n=1 Tax=Neobacillus sp. FSL H8-0543 TaxID=2954672 RepID=UPI0031594236
MHENSYWYIGLGILSIFLLMYVYFKTKSTRFLLHFLAMVGLGYIIETVIYNFLFSYQYFPKLIKHNEIYDSNLGAIASNALALPAAATFIATFHKNWLWILSIIGLFAGIEWAFLELHIYKHNWWRTYYTSLGLPFYFAMAKLLYSKISRPIKGLQHTLLLFLIIGPISGSIHIMPILFFSNRSYELGWFDNISRDTTAFGALYYLTASMIYVILAKFINSPNWVKYIVVALLTHSITTTFVKNGILHSQVWWDPWYYVILSIILMLTTLTISKHLTNGPPKKEANGDRHQKRQVPSK